MTCIKNDQFKNRLNKKWLYIKWPYKRLYSIKIDRIKNITDPSEPFTIYI